MRMVHGNCVIRPMRVEDRLPCGDGRCPVKCSMTTGGHQSHQGESLNMSAFQAVTERLIDLAGTTAILALDHDLVFGFVSFFPTFFPEFDFCRDDQIAEAHARLRQELIVPPPKDAALHVRCLAVKQAYRGAGLGGALVRALQRWAVQHGWPTIVASGCVFSGMARYQWLVSPKPPRPFWEEYGFRISAFLPLSLPSESDDASSRAAFDWYLSGAYPASLPRDIAADEPNWRMIFLDYTMVWRALDDLQSLGV